MAKLMTLQVVGAPTKRNVEGSTLGDVMGSYDIPSSYSAFVNNQPISGDKSSHVLNDGDMLIFTQAVKGNQSWEQPEPVEEEVSPTKFPYPVFESPILNIVCVGVDENGLGYKVNGLRVTESQLMELQEALNGELDL